MKIKQENKTKQINRVKITCSRKQAVALKVLLEGICQEDVEDFRSDVYDSLDAFNRKLSSAGIGTATCFEDVFSCEDALGFIEVRNSATVEPRVA